MSSGFVPLVHTPAPRASTAFRLKVVPSQPNAGNVSSRPLPPQPASQATAPSEPAAQVELVRDGDRVTGARVHCSCGQVIELTFTF